MVYNYVKMNKAIVSKHIYLGIQIGKDEQRYRYANNRSYEQSNGIKQTLQIKVFRCWKIRKRERIKVEREWTGERLNDEIDFFLNKETESLKGNKDEMKRWKDIGTWKMEDELET